MAFNELESEPGLNSHQTEDTSLELIYFSIIKVSRLMYCIKLRKCIKGILIPTLFFN